MKIVLSGVETNNKGAELMLYAILQEIERKWPDAEVFLPYTSVKQGLDYIKTPLKVKYWPISKLLKKTCAHGIFTLLHLPARYMQDVYAVKSADYFIDGSGYLFTDQWQLSKEDVWKWEHLLKRMENQKSRIVFLPQAFGPIKYPNTKQIVSTINRYSSMIMARDHISYQMLNESGLVDMNKVLLFSDFTSLVKGIIPKKYSHLNNAVCVIPNMRMVDMGMMAFDAYLSFLVEIISLAKSRNLKVYLLNHEGQVDEKLAYKCQKSMEDKIEVVTGLNALEVKGLISTAYAVVTSRFHGAVSALNSCVPCLATSWSHKYKELFIDYMMDDCILDINNRGKTFEKISCIFDENQNKVIRQTLSNLMPQKQSTARQMWNYVW